MKLQTNNFLKYLKTPHLWWGVFFFCFQSIHATEFFKEWKNLKKSYNVIRFDTISARMQFLSRIDREFEKRTIFVAKEILHQRVELENILLEFSEDEKQQLFETLNPLLSDMAIDKLASIKSSSLRRMLIELSERQQKGQYFYFNLLGDEDQKTILGKRQAGFHRIEDIIYMGTDKEYKRDWDFILIHELTHFLDKDLKTAAYSYGTPKKMKEILQILNQDSVSQVDKEVIKTHLITGLERGLIAEYRAWVLTLKIYQESKLNIDWIENYLQSCSDSDTLERCIFNSLEKKVIEPTKEGNMLFKYDTYGKLYQEVRRDLRETLPLMGSLGKFTRLN